MPRIFINIAPLQIAAAVGGDRRPALGLAPRRALGDPGEGRQQDEILHGQHDRRRSARQAPTAKPQIALPQPAEPRRPQQPALLRSATTRPSSCARVVHVEFLVAKDLREHRAGRGVVADRLAIDGEIARGGGFGQMEEGEQGAVAAALDRDVVEAALAGREPVAGRQARSPAPRRARSSSMPRWRKISAWRCSSLAWRR